MYISVLVAAVVGFAYILGLLFATPDPSSVILGYFDNSTGLFGEISFHHLGRYSTERIAEILGNNYTGYDENSTISHTPIVNLFVMSSGYSSGLALSILLIINLFFAGMASVTITARITFALARDKAFPFSNILSVVNDTTKSPVYSVIFVWLLGTHFFLATATSPISPVPTSKSKIRNLPPDFSLSVF
jgi:amino acid transporter